jgi:hypothetical protein
MARIGDVMKRFISKLLSKLFPVKDIVNVSPYQRAISLEVWRANRGLKK